MKVESHEVSPKGFSQTLDITGSEKIRKDIET